MKLAVMSDLHLDMMRDYGNKFIDNLDPGDAEVLVIAGDFASARPKDRDQTEEAVLKLCDKYPMVIVTLGNHDSWYTSLTESWAFYFSLEAKFPNFKVLSAGNPFEYKDKRFVGDTLWFRYHPDSEYHLRSWCDFVYIEDFLEKGYQYNDSAISYFKNSMKEGDILVTHHMPHPNAIAPQWAGSDTNMFFLCDISDIIKEKKPALAIFGHTHVPADFTDGDTRFYCNPLGYKFEGTNPKFNERIMIEV